MIFNYQQVMTAVPETGQSADPEILRYKVGYKDASKPFQYV
jgi:hypothetical protein